jgi:outer membrane receptor protein involved in Fe transport
VLVPRWLPASRRRAPLLLPCLITSLIAFSPESSSAYENDQSVTSQKRQGQNPAPDQQTPKANQPTQDPQTTDPVKIDATVTVFGEAEPQKTDLSRDVRSLPVHSSLLQEVELRRRTYREPAEMLRVFPGVDFVYYGQGGIPSGPSVRGYTDRNFGQDMSGHLDGIPLNMYGFVASHGALDLTSIVPETIDRIELIRGPLDARYGDFNRGASVNFVTKERVTRPAATLSVGSFGSWRAAGIYGMSGSTSENMSFYSTFDAHRTSGYSDSQELKHIKTFHKFRMPFDKHDIVVAASTFWSEWDAPSYIDLELLRSGAISDKQAVNPTDGGGQNSQLVYVRYRHGANTSDELAATGYVRHSDWRRFRSDFLISPTQTQVRQLDERVTLGYRIEKNVGHALFGRRSMFVVGSTLHRDDASTSQANTLNRDVLRVTDDVPEVLTSFGLFAQEHLQLSRRLKVMGGLRYSRVDYNIDDNLRAPGTFVDSYSDAQVSPKVGIAFAPMSKLDLYGNVATGMRSPTPRTEVRNSIDSVDSVEIADTVSYEGGIRALLFNRLDLHGNLWRADNSNEVRGIPPGGVQFESLGKSRRNGGGVDAKVFIGPVTRAFASLSWLDVRLLTPVTPTADKLPDIPDFVHQIGVESRIPLPRRAGQSLVVMTDLSFYGRKNLNTTGTLKSERYQRLTFRAIYEHNNRYRAWVGGFAYPSSRVGESAFLFGSRIGVRPNPRVSVDAGLSYIF